MKNIIRNLLAISIAIALLCVPLAVVRLSYEISLVGTVPAIEQLRSDITGIEEPASEDVVGQATAWNQRIRSMQAYNDQWWGDPFIPDQWDSIPVLSIPRTTLAPKHLSYQIDNN